MTILAARHIGISHPRVSGWAHIGRRTQVAIHWTKSAPSRARRNGSAADSHQPFVEPDSEKRGQYRRIDHRL
jgi:hypothetical protein